MVQTVNDTLVRGDNSAVGVQYLELFTHNWVWHAHNVLYNNGSTTPPVTPPLETAIRNKKIFVHFANATVHLKNNTQVPKEIDWYVCVPKTNVVDSEQTIAKEYLEAGVEEILSGRCKNPLTDPNTVDYWSLVQRYGAGASWFKQFADNWTYTKKTIILEPGANYQFSVPGPKNFEYDMNKFVFDNDQVGTSYRFRKGYGVYMWYAIRNIEVLGGFRGSETEPYAHPTVYAGTINHSQTATGLQYQLYGVGCRVKQYLKISPDEATADAQKFDGKWCRLSTGTDQVQGGNPVARIDPINPGITLSTAGMRDSAFGPLGI